MIRILYVMTTLDVGGAERSLLELVRRLDRSQFEPSVCSLISGGRLVKSFEAEGVTVHELGVGAGIAELNGMRIAAVLARVRPHVIHSRLILSNLWARLGRIAAPLICEERGLADDRPHAMTLLNRISAPLATRVVANSEAVATRVRDRDGIGRVIVIRGGVDTEKFTPGTDARCDVVTVTRLERYKGIFDLVEAMREVTAKRPHTTLAIYGGGSLRAELEKTTALAGEVEDVPARLRSARLFVLASHEEGLPNAVMEAMAAGLPVVATAVGGTRELVVDGVTGTLVPPHDPGALARAILAYLDEPARLAAHGRAARERAVAELSIDRVVAHYEALYRELA